MDIALSLSLVIEKGMDDHSQASIAQNHIKAYFDMVPPGRLAKVLMSLGVEQVLAVAIVRLHTGCDTAPRVLLKIGSAYAAIGRRSRGFLTGSKTAALLTRASINGMVAARIHVWAA